MNTIIELNIFFMRKKSMNKQKQNLNLFNYELRIQKMITLDLVKLSSNNKINQKNPN